MGLQWSNMIQLGGVWTWEKWTVLNILLWFNLENKDLTFYMLDLFEETNGLHFLLCLSTEMVQVVEIITHG